MIKIQILIFSLLNIIKLLNCIKLASQNSDFKKDESQVFNRLLQVKNAFIEEQKEQYRCIFMELDRESPVFITELQIFGKKNINHHITLGATSKVVLKSEIQENGNSFECKYDIFENQYQRRLYTWSLNAEGIKFEDGVGFKVGGDTGLNFLTLQIHYTDETPAGYIDNYTGYNLTMTTQQLPYQVGVYSLGTNGEIPPHQKKYYMDSACRYNFKYDMVPIAYRTHAHNIIPVISGYVVKYGEWIELGRMSPFQPEQFYPVTNKDIIVTKGDYLAARCTANSSKRHFSLFTGNTHEDEMCCYYQMFYTDYLGRLKDKYCYSLTDYKWKNDDLLTEPPENSDSLDGVFIKYPEYEKVIA